MVAHPDQPPTDAPDPTRPEDQDPPRPRIGLVLGSGGARGYAHVGVVQALRQRDVDIVAIAGSSMGALVGGLLAAGSLDEFVDWAVDLGQFEVLRYMDLSLSSPGAIRGEKVFGVLTDLLGDQQIEDLPVDFTAVAVDLLAQREVWFQRGPLDVAIRASAAIPSFFVPVTLNGRVLVDGGVLNPVPVAPVAAAHVDRIVAVSLNGPGPVDVRPVEESAEEGEEGEWSDRLRGAAARWFDSDLLASVRRRLSDDLEDSVRSRLATPDTDPADTDAVQAARVERADGLRTTEVIQASFDAMQGALARHRFAGYPPDVLVSVPKTAARALDFHRAGEMVELGRTLAEEALADLPAR